MANTLMRHLQSLQKGRSGWRVLAVGLMLPAALVAWMLIGRFAVGLRGGPGHSLADMPQSAFIEATGVRITLVAVTAGGGMVDLRYQVIDPDKAAIVHDPTKPPGVLDEATGQVVNQPWMQHAHAGQLQAGVTYYLILVNSGGVIKPGRIVSVVIGDSRLEHVIVQ